MGDKGTRVFKKASPNGKLTVYLGKRDFVDHIDLVEPVAEGPVKGRCGKGRGRKWGKHPDDKDDEDVDDRSRHLA